MSHLLLAYRGQLRSAATKNWLIRQKRPRGIIPMGKSSPTSAEYNASSLFRAVDGAAILPPFNPRYVNACLVAQVDGRGVHRHSLDFRPELNRIPSKAALVATAQARCDVDRERPAPLGLRLVDGARAMNLAALPMTNLDAKKVKDAGHRNERLNQLEIDPGHAHGLLLRPAQRTESEVRWQESGAGSEPPRRTSPRSATQNACVRGTDGTREEALYSASNRQRGKGLRRSVRNLCENFHNV